MKGDSFFQVFSCDPVELRQEDRALLKMNGLRSLDRQSVESAALRLHPVQVHQRVVVPPHIDQLVVSADSSVGDDGA